MESVTREMKKLIKDEAIRKNVTKIYKDFDEEYESIVYYIYFKEETVRNTYEDEYMDYTVAMENELYKGAEAINEWLKEIAYVA